MHVIHICVWLSINGWDIEALRLNDDGGLGGFFFVVKISAFGDQNIWKKKFSSINLTNFTLKIKNSPKF